eukprot:TRINITY_DN319_c0_g1_i16.p2 TRINITY_DN319_c0_g1~~TRINITY_DN319_c0_g1_i16.p2  ORF type:complete len:108 (-),score=9.84 TRINITY_DN319_c0_g1_i16:874-1197(-)
MSRKQSSLDTFFTKSIEKRKRCNEIDHKECKKAKYENKENCANISVSNNDVTNQTREKMNDHSVPKQVTTVGNSRGSSGVFQRRENCVLRATEYIDTSCKEWFCKIV